MATETTTLPTSITPSPDPSTAPPAVRLWLGLALVAVFWAAHLVMGRLEKPYFVGFLFNLATSALLPLLFYGWWLTRRAIPRADRWFGFLATLGGGILIEPLCDPSVGWFGLLFTALPAALTVWILWAAANRGAFGPRLRWGGLALVALVYGYFTLVRIDGLDADLKANNHWRWEPRAEDLFLAEQGKAAEPTGQRLPDWAPVPQPGDWLEFRGPDRAGGAHGAVAADWKANAPRQVWRRRVGPAWSSVLIVNGRLFTQEQRGEREAVVCYDAATGQPLWAHEDAARFWEAVSGAGPRATPTFAEGRLYTQGATGILNCLDAATGQRRWSHDVAKEAGAAPPMWGYSSSPLVADGLVIAYAGGEGDKSLLAFRAATGDVAWTAAVGPLSYSSPQLVTLGGQRQILMLTDQGLTALDLANGAILWKAGTVMAGAPRAVQPRAVGPDQLLVGTLDGQGVTLLEVTRDGSGWKATPRWQSTDLKPEFPDMVVHQGHAYGFDGSIFGCIDLATGKRRWKGGRYGRGEVLLLADQGLLLVVTETGEVVLLPAQPDGHKELGRFKAFEGKTWNHPVVAHGRLYLRNAEEMACYALPGPTGP
jgi:outer membrane protein assembly factor BamB